MSEKKSTVPVVDFKEQNQGERQLFLHKLKDDDFIPGTTVTLAEAREQHEARVKEQNDQRLARRARVIAERQENRTETQTELATVRRVVVPGILVDIAPSKVDAVAVAATSITNAPPPAPTDLEPLDEKALRKMSYENLQKTAEERGVPFVAEQDSKEILLDRLIGTLPPEMKPEPNTGASDTASLTAEAKERTESINADAKAEEKPAK